MTERVTLTREEAAACLGIGVRTLGDWTRGAPGYTVPAPPEPITLSDADAPWDAPVLRTGDACPGHEYAVRRTLFEHPEFTSLTGR